MNKHLVAVLLAAATLSAPALKASAQAFEGTVVWTMSIPQLDEEKHEMLINIKGEKTEMEMDMGVQGKISIYPNQAGQKTYMVIQAQHAGFTRNDAPSATAPTVELKATGNKKTVNGHAAEEFTIAAAQGTMTLWASNDFPKEVIQGFQKAMAASSRGADQSEAFKKLADKGMFPVKVELKDAGETQMAMDLVKLEPKKLADALFVPPSDIKFRPMPTGMGGQD